MPSRSPVTRGMRCWRCGSRKKHKVWCSMPGGCKHCGWDPHREWCTGEVYDSAHGTGWWADRRQGRPLR